MIVGQRRRQVVVIPQGGQILWHGSAWNEFGVPNLPSGFDLSDIWADCFVKGGASATDLYAGDHSHSHGMGVTGSVGNHTHTTGAGWSGNPNDDTLTAQTLNGDPIANDTHQHYVSAKTSSEAGGHSHGLSTTGLAAVYPPYIMLHWIMATENMPVPIGGIIMWFDDLAERPKGFEICDGSPGRPDMRGRFIFAAGTDANVGVAGGSATHTHTNSNTGSGGYHRHTVSSVSFGASNSEINEGHPYPTDYSFPNDHTHSGSGTFAYDNDHTHTIDNTYEASSLPPYVNLYYLIRME